MFCFGRCCTWSCHLHEKQGLLRSVPGILWEINNLVWTNQISQFQNSYHSTFLAAFLKKPEQIAFCTLDTVFPHDTTSSLCLSIIPNICFLTSWALKEKRTIITQEVHSRLLYTYYFIQFYFTLLFLHTIYKLCTTCEDIPDFNEPEGRRVCSVPSAGSALRRWPEDSFFSSKGF